MDPNEKTNSTASQTDLQARRTCGVIHRGSRPGEARPDARSSHRPAPCGLFDYIELFISCRSGCAFATLRSCMTAYFLLVRGRPGRRRGQRTEFGLQRNITYSVCSKVTFCLFQSNITYSVMFKVCLQKGNAAQRGCDSPGECTP